jgi:hypothetical protein
MMLSMMTLSEDKQALYDEVHERFGEKWDHEEIMEFVLKNLMTSALRMYLSSKMLMRTHMMIGYLLLSVSSLSTGSCVHSCDEAS